jgi:hypothetical protein
MTACIFQKLEDPGWKEYPVHKARVVLPEKLACLINRYPQIISLIVDHLPPDHDVNRDALAGAFSSLPFLSHSTQSPVVSVAIRFTRLQWAKFRGLGHLDILPAYRRMGSVDTYGKLIMSGLCCLIKRNNPDICEILSQIVLDNNHSDVSLPITSSVKHLIKSAATLAERSQDQFPLEYLDIQTDDAWLSNIPSKLDDDPVQFEEIEEAISTMLKQDLEDASSSESHSSGGCDSHLEGDFDEELEQSMMGVKDQLEYLDANEHDSRYDKMLGIHDVARFMKTFIDKIQTDRDIDSS